MCVNSFETDLLNVGNGQHYQITLLRAYGHHVPCGQIV